MRQPADERTALTSGDTMVLPAMNAEDQADEIEILLPPPPVVPPQEQPAGILRRRWFWAASIVIPLLVGFVIYQLSARSQSVATVPSELLRHESPHESAEPAPVAQPPSFATVMATVGAQWGGAAAQPLPGQRLPGTPLFLQSGCAEIKFDSGATMIVEAPARFQVGALNAVELTSGRIAAKVPPSAHGFAVDTAAGRVVDLGTEFGVAISPDGSDQIDVFKGKVMAAGPQSAGSVDSLMLSTGQAAVSTGHDIKLDPAGAQPQAFVRSLTPPASIDMIDLICGGDGSTHLRNGSIDQRTGESGQHISMSNAGAAPADFHEVPGLQVVDGCFVPNGRDMVDSAHHVFDFGATNARTLYTIRAGGTVPWPNPGETFTGVLSGVDYTEPNHGLILLHPNIGITFDLDAIRRIHPGLKVADFRAVIGNSCPGASRGISAHVHVLVDGVLRSDIPALTHNDGAVNLRVSLANTDRFLTIAITDSRKTVVRNWIILGDPRLE